MTKRREGEILPVCDAGERKSLKFVVDSFVSKSIEVDNSSYYSFSC
jgi:hypothetical protein